MSEDPADRLQFWTLYLARFAGGFGLITLTTLIPEYVNAFGLADDGLLVGLLYSGFTLAQTLAVVPLAWAGDRYDKRLVLLGVLALGVPTYLAFGYVPGAGALAGVRVFQGIVATGMGLMTLALVGELATPGTRAGYIGKSNAARFAAGILGGLAAAVAYDYFDGFEEIFWTLTGLYAVTLVLTALFLSADDTRIPGFPFSDLAVNRRILTLTSFRAQYAVAVTLVRSWVPLFAGVAGSGAGAGLGYSGLALGASSSPRSSPT